MEQVEEICDHIILVNRGKKILDGSVSGVRQQFKENLFSVGLEDLIPKGPDPNMPGPIHARVDPWSSAPIDLKPFEKSPVFEAVGSKKDQLIVKIRDGYSPNDVLSWFIGQGRSIVGFTEILPSLNDIFIRLVEGTPLSRQFQPVKD